MKNLSTNLESKIIDHYESANLRDFYYQNRLIGRVKSNKGKPYFEPALSQPEILELVEEMPTRDKIHMWSNAHGVYMSLVHYGQVCKENRTHEIIDCYIGNEELVIYAADLNCRNATELYHKDRRAYKLLHDRNLLDNIFPELKFPDIPPKARALRKDRPVSIDWAVER